MAAYSRIIIGLLFIGIGVLKMLLWDSESAVLTGWAFVLAGVDGFLLHFFVRLPNEARSARIAMLAFAAALLVGVAILFWLDMRAALIPAVGFVFLGLLIAGFLLAWFYPWLRADKSKL